MLIRRNLIPLKKNARLENQLQTCKQTLENLQSYKLNMLADVVLEVDKGNHKSQKFMYSECKAIFREVGCLDDLQTGEEKPQEPLSIPKREILPESSPPQGAP